MFTVKVIVQRFTGIQLNAQTIWSWVQLWGKQAMNQLQEEMAQLALGQEPTPEAISSKLTQMPKRNRCRWGYDPNASP